MADNSTSPSALQSPAILFFYTGIPAIAMYAHITPMRLHGKALEQHQIRSAQAVWGDIIVSHQNVTALGRYSDVATVAAGDGRKDALLPALYDCRLSHMGTNGFVLAGLQLEGSIAFAQNWWCRPG
jgi:hypothetical protein